jgi:DNA-3-methyladenine glycosylase II
VRPVPHTASVTRRIAVTGAFSLRAAAEFGFGPNEGRAPAFDGVMRLAFPLDPGIGYAGAILTQPEPDGPVTAELELRDGAEADDALAQVSRIVSLDHDGAGFEEVGERDPVIRALQRAFPGQRPVLFASPYEAAAWAIISARRPAARAADVREELSLQLGETFELAGRPVRAFPRAEHLQQLGEEFAGLTMEKIGRLLDVAEAARLGVLEASALQALGPEEAFARVQRLKGIGPFYAGLIVLRAVGFADASLPMVEPRLLGHAARLYELDGEPTLDWFNRLAERWRPYRVWASVLIRLAGGRGTTISIADPSAREINRG